MKSIVRNNNPGLQRWHYLIQWIKEFHFDVGVEVGVKSGRVTCALLKACPELKMYAVDPWAYVGRWAKYKAETWDHERWYRNFRRNISPYKDRCEVMRMTSLEAASLIDPNSVDFVFLDGDHSTPGVAEDSAAWIDKIRPGGILAGHDIQLPTVKKAVDLIFPNANITETDFVWWVKC